MRKRLNILIDNECPEGRFLPVIINCQEDINQSFLLGLNKALNRSGLSNLTPKTDFLCS